MVKNMGNKLQTFFRKNSPFILYVILTSLSCLFCAEVFGPGSDNIFFVNIVLAGFIWIFLLKSVFTGKYKNLLKVLIYIVSILISSNHLYSFIEIQRLIGWVKSFNYPVILAVIIFVYVGGAVGAYLLRYFSIISSQSDDSKDKILPAKGNHLQGQSNIAKSKERTGAALRIFGIIVIIVTIVILSIWLYFNLDFPEISSLNIYSDISVLVSSLIGSGASILFIIFAISIIIIALIELARFLYRRLLLFRVEKDVNNNDNSSLTYVFSVLIVFAMLFITYRVSNFTLDDFTEIVSKGDYIALPLIILVGIIAVVLLIRLIHGILILVMKSEPIEIDKFIRENEKILKIKQNIVDITKFLVQIIFGTITSALELVKFIPDFVKDLKIMILDDEKGE